MKKIFNILGGISIVALSTISCTFAYTQEQKDAYQWVYRYGITTQSTIEDAKMNSPLTRQAFAKMVVSYLENVVGIKQSTFNSCYFPDENKITNDLKPYTKKVCAYEIMGSNGKNFKPTDPIDRAQLGTVISRMLWGDQYNVGGKGYYIYHVNALQSAGIMNNIKDVVGTPAKRGDVMIMFKRMYEKFSSNVYMNDGIKNNNYNSVEINQLNNDDILNEIKKEFAVYNMSFDGEIFKYYDNGEWIFYHRNGKVGAKGHFKNGKLNGEINFYYEDGNFNGKLYFKDGKLDGEIISYYENGQLRGKAAYKDGELIGEAISYYENGQLQAKTVYKDGEFDGESVSYYENGQLQARGIYKNGKADGEFILYYENGNLQTKVTYKDGLVNGEFISYYQNGKTELMCNYIDGVIDGQCTRFDENGEAVTVQNFINQSNILPDSAEISLKDSITMGKPTDFKVTMIKNGFKMDDYDGDIRIIVTDENGKMLKSSEYTVANQGIYSFSPSDLGEKEFNGGLTINKEGTFYIEVMDLTDDEDNVLGKKLVTVVKST